MHAHLSDLLRFIRHNAIVLAEMITGVNILPALSPTAAQTRENIKNAFWRLYTAQPIEKITVSEVCETAGYNRSTFYAYFHDMYDVLDCLEHELIPADKLMAVIFNDLLKKASARETLTAFMDLFLKCDVYFSVLLGPNGDPAFREKLLSQFTAAFARALPEGLTKPCRYVLAYQNAGVILTIARWYESGKDIPAETLLDLLLDLTREGTQAVFTQTCREAEKP